MTLAHVRTLALFALLMTAGPATLAQSVRLPATRDLWLSSVTQEVDGNNGAASRLKFKSYQEMSIIDFDPASLRGRVVTAATLHLKNAADPPLRRVTVSSLSAPWVEGRSTSYRPEVGSSTFRSSRHPDTPWTPDGGDLCRVMLGQGSTLWGMADATKPDPDGWQKVAVDPRVVALRASGLSEGFLVFDDTGTEWTRAGEKFTSHHMPNRFAYSRDQNSGSAPYLTVTFGPEDRSPPRSPGSFRVEVGELPAGEARVGWTSPGDDGPAGVAGFVATVDGRRVPMSLTPLAGPEGERVVLHLRDLGLKPGAEVELVVRAVDAAGNVGPEAATKVRVSSRVAAPLPGANPPPPSRGPVEEPRLGGSIVAVIDELDKVRSADGSIIPEPPPGYRASNHIWSARGPAISLEAARNEFVAFQVVVFGRNRDVQARLSFDGPGGPKLRAGVGRYLEVASKRGALPDPIVPLGGPEDRGVPDEPAKSQSLHVEVFVPHDAAAGAHSGTLTLTSGSDRLSIPVRLRVWDFTLPDHLSFLPEMNCYGLPKNERDYYRLAHEHRTVLDRVPYSQRGEVEDGSAPAWDGRTLDWTAWDRRFGPLLDGSAFADLPRRGVPLEVFYLPIHENWPKPIEPNYNGGYWADQAFTPEYRQAFVAMSRAFSDHLNKNSFHETLFLGFLNNKVDFKRNGWSRASSPWLLDEPANFQDFWALRYFAAAFHEGVRQAPGEAKLVFRADVSRPQWQRDSLDGLLDYNVVSSAMRPYHRIVFDRKRDQGQVVLEYGSTNAVEESNLQPVGWSLDVWALGGDGLIPWQTVGRGDSWTTADPLALFYPGRRGNVPMPSVRLKAYRRGQQDVEYLTLLSQLTGEPRWALGKAVREELGLVGRRGASGLAAIEDAGMVRYDALRPEQLRALRARIGQVLDSRHPQPKRKLVDFRTPPRDPSTLRPRLVAP